MNKMYRKLDQTFIRWFNIHPVKVERVFTPSTSADINYINRPELESLIRRDIHTPGKQILVYGHSGSGKTTLVRKILEEEKLKYVITQCEETTSFEQLILNAFDSLGKCVVSQKVVSKSNSQSSSLMAEYNGIKSQIGSEFKTTVSCTITPLIPPQLTPQKLAYFFGESDIVWIIEDFHKVRDAEKKRIADILKIFVDTANEYQKTRIICIGACDSINDLLNYDSNLRNRVAEIEVTLLSDKSIRAIISNGFHLLNVNITAELEDKLVYYASRLGSQAHQMCMDICLGKKIQKRSRRPVYIGDEAFAIAVNSFINDNKNTLTTIYESAIKNEIGWYVLKTFSSQHPNKLSFREIKRIINQSKYTFEDADIKQTLENLMSPSYSVIVYHNHSEKYSLASPFWDAFLRMQFSIEEANKNKKIHDKQNQSLKIKSVDMADINAMVEERLLELLRGLSSYKL